MSRFVGRVLSRRSQSRRGVKVRYGKCSCSGKSFMEPCTCFCLRTNNLNDSDFYKQEMEIVGLVKGKDYSKHKGEQK